MRVVLAWSDNHTEYEGAKSILYDIAFRPDGTQLVAAIGSRVVVYNAITGDLIHSLKGHKGAVHCVAYSRDGKRFASGGSDKTIIIWTHKAEGILKYSHSDSIQCLAYNPVTQQLASGTSSDFGIWSPEQKSVSKHKAASKVLSASWTADGQQLALGMQNGQIHIFDRDGNHHGIIECPGPVWTLQWNITQMKTSDTLAVGCWNGTLSFYNLAGKQIGKERPLGFDPCSVSYHDSKYLCVGGSGKQVLFYSKDGIQLSTLCETSDWVWAVRSRPKSDFIAVGCNDGSISMLQLVFSTVHGLYQEKYAFRDAMTDIVIQDLVSCEKVKIKCQDYVKKIAIYKRRVAVQLSNQIVIYEFHNDSLLNSQYRVFSRLDHSLECNLLILTSEHITLCQETKLQLFSFSGTKEREWVFESAIRYIKVCGGPEGAEGLLVGTKNGLVVRVWINSSFPIHLFKHSSAIRCLDLSAKRSHLAVVDENTNILVIDLQKKEICFEDKHASSVAWNTEFNTMLCYSGNGNVSIKTADFSVQQQRLQGYVVGFQGSRMFCLHHLTMQTIEVPQSVSMRKYLQIKDFEHAYRVACLGVTEADWRMLAIEALQGQAWKIAHSGFARIRDVRYLDLLSLLNQEPCDKSSLTAFVRSFQGKFEEAAQAYCEVGQVEKAMEMYADLRMFDKAKALAECIHNKDKNSKANVQEIIQRQAEWTEEKNDHETAADMYLIAGQLSKALAILVEYGPWTKLIEVARRLRSTDTHELSLCATSMCRKGLYAHAFETYTKLGDFRSILQLHIELQQWDDAFTVKRLHPELQEDVFIPYAEWLIRSSRHEDACMAYKQAGRPDLSDHLLKELIQNAVQEKRFKDASYNYWQMACEKVSQLSRKEADQAQKIKELKNEGIQYRRNAEIYFAYSFIDQSMNEPFRTTLPETLFNIACFLLPRVSREPLPGVSLVNILVTLARQGEQIGCYKFAQDAYENLQKFRVPTSWVDKLEIATLACRGHAASQKGKGVQMEAPCCYYCSSPLPLPMHITQEACVVCSQPIFRSFLTFDQLPLVEFFLEETTTHEEAMQVLLSCTSEAAITFDASRSLLALPKENPGPLCVTSNTLSKMEKSRVIVEQRSKELDYLRYFFVLDPSLPIVQCPYCANFFEQEEWDSMLLKEGYCPFCQNFKEDAAVYLDNNSEKPGSS